MKLRHRPREALAASCVIVVCRFQKIGRTEKEVLAVCVCTKKHLAVVLRGVTRVICELSKRRMPVSTAKVNHPAPMLSPIALYSSEDSEPCIYSASQDVIQRFCTNMNIPILVASTASHIVKEIDRRGICQSRLISSVAGAAIFIACLVCEQEVKPQGVELVQAVSSASGAADATIKEVCKALYPYKSRILPTRYIACDLSILLH
jgi:transcription initiation factor TFIIB